METKQAGRFILELHTDTVGSSTVFSAASICPSAFTTISGNDSVRILSVCACVSVTTRHAIENRISLFISSVIDRLLSVYTHFKANRSLLWLQNYINHSRQQRNLPDICLTFAVIDGIASARRPTAAYRNESDYSRLRSLCPAWLPLYLLFVALNRQDTLNPIRRASR